MASVAEVADEHADAIAALARGGLAVLNADDPSIGVWRAAAARGGRARRAPSASPPARTCAARRPAPRARPRSRSSRRRVASRRRSRCPASRWRATRSPRRAWRSRPALRPTRSRAASPRSARPPGGSRCARCRRARPLVDDTYNANPDSVRAAIDVLAAMPAPRVLVLGDMGEVGAQGPAYHREIGAYARERGIDAAGRGRRARASRGRRVRRRRAATTPTPPRSSLPRWRRSRRPARRSSSRARASCAWSASSGRLLGESSPEQAAPAPEGRTDARRPVAPLGREPLMLLALAEWLARTSARSTCSAT